MADTTLMDKLVSLAKRRGFVFQSSEIYGGLGSVWDYGPLGVELKRNVKERWWTAMVHARDDIEGLDAAILMHPRVWEASGHVAGFTDPMVDCRTCKARFRADKLPDASCPQKPSKHPGEHSTCSLTEPRLFNLMFKTFIGPVEEQAAVVYLRPETAQGIYVNYQNVLNSSRQRVPFGIAQVGKAFRNEITPGNFIFRTREFEQMEIEYFVNPHETVDGRPADEYWHDRWIADCLGWFQRYGLQADNLRLHEHERDELAHYSKRTADVQYRFPIGWSELMGIANRTDFDLKQHAKFSGKALTYFDEERKEHLVPFVIEPSAGVDRALLAFLADAYREEEVRGEKRVVLRLHPELAPVSVAVLPLLKKRDDIVRKAHAIREDLARRLTAVYDDTAAIGRLYRRQDEVGTPYCVTVDVQTVGDTDKGERADDKVTIRDRDSMEQIRVAASQLTTVFGELLAGKRWADVAAGVAAG
ncbi:MAG TPA: glycine--tRNA ligase [Gemmatimonadales bacterium]|nr:glycine--tRNA ligase [Gemmatimonadales bacterium]